MYQLELHTVELPLAWHPDSSSVLNAAPQADQSLSTLLQMITVTPATSRAPLMI